MDQFSFSLSVFLSFLSIFELVFSFESSESLIQPCHKYRKQFKHTIPYIFFAFNVFIDYNPRNFDTALPQTLLLGLI